MLENMKENNVEFEGTKMLRIAICDDKDTVRQTVKESVEKYLSETGLLYEIDTFASCEELLELGIEVICYSVIFLDVNERHFVTAKKLREYSSEPQMVFLAEDTAYSLEGYKVGAVRYLLKDDVLETSVYECMEAVCDKMNSGVTRKVFKFNECEKEVSGYKMVLNNNQVLMIPKTRYRDVKNAFMGYLGKAGIVKA